MAKLVSKTYGDALFAVGTENDRLDELADEVKAVQSILQDNPDFIRMIENPQIRKAEKMKIIEEIFRGRVSEDMMGFLAIIVTKDRTKDLSSVFEYFIKRFKEYKRIGMADVISSAELGDEWKHKIERKLLDTTSYLSMEIRYHVEPALIGGLIIRIGDRVVDSSIKSKLESLRGELMKLSLDA